MAADTTIRYPDDIQFNTTDWVRFEFFQYKPPYGTNAIAAKSSTTGGVDADAYKQYNVDVSASLAKAGYPSIALYMPEDIAAAYQGSWSGRGFGPLAPIAMNAMGPILSARGIGSIKTAAQAATNAIGGIRLGAIPYIGASVTAEVMNKLPGFGGGVSGNDILASTRGQILNPNMEVLYQGPELRTFSLNYKMFGRNQKEIEKIRSICKIFKRAMLPTTGGEAEKNLINVPKVVKVTFMHKDKPNEWISQFKTCAIGGVDVNYTPDGSWATYQNGQPIATQLTLQFQELKLLYEQDVDAGY